jgi:hypothetical protein
MDRLLADGAHAGLLGLGLQLAHAPVVEHALTQQRPMASSSPIVAAPWMTAADRLAQPRRCNRPTTDQDIVASLGSRNLRQ